MNHDHVHVHRPEAKCSWWFTREGIVSILFIAIIGIYLVTEHLTLIYQALPWLLVVACLVMHAFMHHGLSGHNHDQDGRQ